MESSGVEAYQLGRRYDRLPIPMVEDVCIDVPAGPVVFVVEPRVLSEEVALADAAVHGRTDGFEPPRGVWDGGMTIHVLAAADRVEHLRFDCFDVDPHYHYIDNDRQANVVVRIDSIAEDDTEAWVLGRLRARLPEMLEYAGAKALADATRAAPREVADGLAEIEKVLQAGER